MNDCAPLLCTVSTKEAGKRATNDGKKRERERAETDEKEGRFQVSMKRRPNVEWPNVAVILKMVLFEAISNHLPGSRNSEIAIMAFY